VNILLINHYAGSQQHGMEFRPFYLAREWVRGGHQVQIVAASYSHIRAKQPIVPDAALDEQIEGVHYRWYATPTYKGNGLGRVSNILVFLRAVWCDSRWFANVFKPDVVIASSTYPMDIWPARRIAHLAGAKLVYEVHDLWPLSPIELGGMSRWNPFIMWVQLAENYAYRNADRVISMLPNIADYIVEKGVPLEHLTIVPNGVSLDDWQRRPAQLPSELEVTIELAKISNNKIVVYTGSHGSPNALDNLLNTAALLQKCPVKFIIVGDGHERERLLARVRNENLSNVHMYGPIEKSEVLSLLSKSDMAYLGAPYQPLYRFGVSPNKLIDYMMAGVPVLFAIEAGNNPVKQADCGLEVPPEDPIALASAIEKLIALPSDRLRVMGENGRRYAFENHMYDILAKKFLDSLSMSVLSK
jgi:glycosyltransferase involved in cell wall biosynthesis